MKNKTLIYIIILLLFFSCKKENTLLSAQNFNDAKDSTKIITLPIDSIVFNYSNKDKNGYFIYDKTFKKNKYSNNLSRLYGKLSFDNKIDLLFVERKSNDDESIEPIVTLYSFEKDKKQKIDSLNIYETLKSEGNLQKRFSIGKDKLIHIYENSSGYDFTDDGKEILINEKKHETYTVSSSGKFILQQNKPTENLKKSNLSKPDKSWIGEYSIKTDAISNADGKKFTLRYYITLNSLSDATLSIGAEDPQDYNCEGDYILQIESNILHGSGKCDSDDINDFYLKKESGKYYIKSKRFINQDWQELKKENLK
ncbi:hypothetical protein [Chryseobacterium scophthalmum]|uniref:hypothetical protein n=1 Tax=Chryseobacterium scophthalmum TaxID=59733 RepID=UPI001AEC0955|nr:hypothetical protein [Chryseobacterium scophthalmum]